MQSNVKVSILMPVYNTSSRLHAALKSALAQTIDTFEIVIVNDGSKDDSSAILNEYAKKYPDRIKLIETPNRGVARARNTAIENASGEWIYFCDSDDIIEPDTCEYLYGRATKSNAEIATCRLLRKREDGTVLDGVGMNCKTQGEEIIGREEVLKRWLKPMFRLTVADRNKAHCYLVLCLFKREIIMKNNIRFEDGLIVHCDESLLVEYLNYVDTAALSDRPLYSYIYFDHSICSNFFRHTPNMFKVEKNHFMLARMRRRIWEKFFDDDRGLAMIFASESYHRCMMNAAEKDKSFAAKFAQTKSAIADLKGMRAYGATLANADALAKGKRAFMRILKAGTLPVYLFCAAMLFINRRKKA